MRAQVARKDRQCHQRLEEVAWVCAMVYDIDRHGLFEGSWSVSRRCR